MCGADIFYEGGKYSVILILGLSLIHRKQKYIPVAPLFYFLLLLPSIILTLETMSADSARAAISFNLSGPLTLFISTWFFSTLKIKLTQMLYLMLFLVAPIITTAAGALSETLVQGQIRWVNDSMLQTSGGFGPNQVSTIMGLGAIVIWMFLLFGRSDILSKLVLAGSGVLLIVQGLLTFSRGGMVAVIIVTSFLSIYTVRNTQQRTRMIFLIIISVSALIFLVFPMLNDYTQGFLETRFGDVNLSNRDTLLQVELDLFIANPIAGVGPGVANTIRTTSSHTEMTRLLADHGLFGLVSLILLILMTVQRYLSVKDLALRGLYGSFILWTLIVMTNTAMRIAATGFCFGLAFVQIQFDD